MRQRVTLEMMVLIVRFLELLTSWETTWRHMTYLAQIELNFG